jgi:hypothetical protein
MVWPSRTMTFATSSLVTSSGMVTAAPVASVTSRMMASETWGLSSMRIEPSFVTKGRT